MVMFISPSVFDPRGEGFPRPGEPYRPGSRYEVVCTIRILDEYVEALEGLRDYSHMVVIFWMHGEKGYRPRVKPWGVERYPEVGIFATRFPPRPNSIAITVVELIEIGGRLRVRGLDAWKGSPVLDIKPYDHYDIVKNPRTPWWVEERWGEMKEKKGYKAIAPWLGPCENNL